MKFVVIDPQLCKVAVEEANQLSDLYHSVGLPADQVEFSCVHSNEKSGETISIVVYEFGLFKPKEMGKYFSLGGQLLEGGAILFAADYKGETISFVYKPPVVFYRSYVEVEQAIERGEVVRPEMAVNGEVIWKWPDPQVTSRSK